MEGSVAVRRVAPCTSHSRNTRSAAAEEREVGWNIVEKETSVNGMAKTDRGGETSSVEGSQKDMPNAQTHTDSDTDKGESSSTNVESSKSDEENDPSLRDRAEKKRSYAAAAETSPSSATPSPPERPPKRRRESSPKLETKIIVSNKSLPSSDADSSVATNFSVKKIARRSNTMRPLHLGDDPKKRAYYSPPSSCHGASVAAVSGERLGRNQKGMPGGIRCKNCLSANIVTDRREGMVYCKHCGEVVVTKIMMDECEWRVISNGKLNTEGSRVVQRNYMLETFVKRRLRIRECSASRDDRGAGMTGGEHGATQRDHNLRSETVEIKILLKQLGRLQTICKYLELKKKVTDHASEFFAHLKCTPGVYGPVRPKNGLRVADLMAAAIFASCRLNRVAVTRREICAVAKAGKSSRCASLFRLLQADLKLKISPPASGDFLPRLIDILGLSRGTLRAAQIICSRCGDFGLSPDKTVPAPATTAAAAAYVASQMSSERNSLCSDELKELCIRILHLSKRAFRRMCAWITENLDAFLSTDDIDLLSQYGVEVERLKDIRL